MPDQFPPLLEALARHSTGGPAPMHMPGHKRNAALAPYLSALGAAWDITEIHGFDDLHEAEGILKDSMDRAARLWGAQRSFYLVNGSTCGILAGIRAAAGRGGKVILSRGCHKSVYHALELCGAVPVWLAPPVDESFGVLASITPEQVRAALAAHPDAKLLVLTSPTYEGVISDLAAICAAAHAAGVPMLVDEAHGAHLGLAPGWPAGAVAAGADVVVQSLHKTLPSLTQTGILHQQGDLISAEALARQLGIFETSSPSYLLMASMDGCVDLLERRGGELFARWQAALAAFDRAIAGLARLRVLCHGADTPEQHPGIFAHDPGKLVISTRSTALTGPGLMARLREEFSIELEMASGDWAIAMTGLGDTEENLLRLARALMAIDKSLAACPMPPAAEPLPLPPTALPVAQALELPCEEVPLAGCEGRVSAEYVWAYPPGIPLIVPGERVDRVFLDCCARLNRQGVRLHSTGGTMPRALRVLHPSSNPTKGD